MQLALAKNIKYVWGKTDCSGTLADIFIKSGIPVRRTTAARMYQGLDGWTLLTEFEFADAKKCAIIVWTMKPERPHGHVGVTTDDTYHKVALWFAHASSSQGFDHDKMFHVPNGDGTFESDYFYDRLDKIFEVKGVE